MEWFCVNSDLSAEEEKRGGVWLPTEVRKGAVREAVWKRRVEGDHGDGPAIQSTL